MDKEKIEVIFIVNKAMKEVSYERDSLSEYEIGFLNREGEALFEEL